MVGHNSIHPKGREATTKMEVLSTTPLSDKAAAKLLKKFVESKEGEENADLVVCAASEALCVHHLCGLSVEWQAGEATD